MSQIPNAGSISQFQGYFDTLRMELADTGVDVMTVCPGPVDTPFMREIFGRDLLEKRKVCVHIHLTMHVAMPPRLYTQYYVDSLWLYLSGCS